MPQRRTPSGQRPGSASPRGNRSEPGPARVRAARTSAPAADDRPTVLLRTDRAAGRPASHPATARRSASTGAAKRTAAPTSGRFTGRAAALGLVVLALMLAYAYPVRLYLDQQAEIQRLELAQAAQRARIGQLTTEAQKWNDPAYIKAQARARFQMVEPGETAYIVLPPDPAPTDAGSTTSTTSGTWYGALWGSIQGADGQ